MPTILGQNQYGKAENRVVKITRDGATHHIKDLNVSVALSGDMDEVHYSGSNANVLPTDTTKNTVYAFAKEHGIESAEQFGIHLARHFVTSQEPIHRPGSASRSTPGSGSRPPTPTRSSSAPTRSSTPSSARARRPGSRRSRTTARSGRSSPASRTSS